MLSRITYIFFCALLLIGLASCGTSNHSRGPKEYIEKNGLHSDKKPHEMAAEIGAQQKGQERAYKKALKRRKKNMAKTGRPGE